MKHNDITKIDLPEFLPQLPDDFTYRRTNVFYLPSFSQDINDDIDVLNDSENLYKLDKVFEDAARTQEDSSVVQQQPKDNRSIISNKATYLTYHNTLNNDYFINNLPSLTVNKNLNTRKDVDILRVVEGRLKQRRSIESKEAKRENNMKRNVFTNQLQSSTTTNFDIKLPDNKFSHESYIKLDKLRAKKINKFKENEVAWQQMKYDIFKRLEQEYKLRKEMEMEEKRLREMEELKRRQDEEATGMPQYLETEEKREGETKMVFKLAPVEKPALKPIKLSFGGVPIRNPVKQEEETTVREKWVTLRCSPEYLRKLHRE